MRSARRSATSVLLALCVIAQPAAGRERPGRPDEWTLSFQGFGPVRVGMTVREAEKALKMKLQEEETAQSEPDGCHYASNDDALPGIGLMVEGRRIVRIDVFSGPYRTRSGVHVGMTEQDVKSRHPRIESEKHFYDPSGHYLSLSSDDQRYRMRFETDGNVVTTFRSGERGAVAYVEGCQ
jgi:hypothetical protein